MVLMHVCVYVTSCERRMSNLIPHYLSSYIPMCLVMIANPILYSKTTAAGFRIQLFVISATECYYQQSCSYHVLLFKICRVFKKTPTFLFDIS